MTYNELIMTPEYWTTKIQLDLFDKVEQYMQDNKLTRSDFAKKIGVSKGYVTQILNGDFDHRISKLAELSIAIGYYPNIEFKKYQEESLDKKTILENVFKQLNSINHTALICPKIESQRRDSFVSIKQINVNKKEGSLKIA